MTTAIAILLGGLLLGAIVLMVLGTYMSNRIFTFTAAALWIGFGMINYTVSAGAWDVYYGLFLFGIMMVIICMLMPATRREETLREVIGIDDEDDEEEEDEEQQLQVRRYRKTVNKIEDARLLMRGGVSRRRRRASDKRDRRWERTGEE